MPKQVRYSFVQTCKCGYKKERFLSKKQAAFNLLGSNYMTCIHCGEIKPQSSALSKPELDNELLQIWGTNEEYYFSEQDEDLFLADINNLDVLLEGFDNQGFLQDKKGIIASALFVLFVDNLSKKSVILPELLKRKTHLLNYKKHIWGYLWKKVEPHLKTL